MRKQVYLSVLINVFLAFAVAGCASYIKRKECEKTNWFQHGYSVAMAGKRLDADDFAKQCQKAEAQMSWSEMDTGFKAGMAKYCSVDNVYQVGKAGKPFSYDMCDGENLNKMRARWNDGIKVFCEKENGYPFGAGGGVYQNVCPKIQESAWLPEYRRGRKVYLNLMVEEKSKSLQQLESRNRSLESQKMQLNFQRASLQGRTVVRVENFTDPKTGQVRQQTKIVPDPNAQREADQLTSQVYSVDSQLRANRQQQDTLSQEITAMRTEMLSL